MKKKLTIFTPTYNRAHTIGRVYDSLLIQDQKRLNKVEWLIVDDGSTDSTNALISKWQTKEHPFELRYIKQSNGGKHTAFNRAIEEAKGEYFFTVDSDDWLVNDCVKYIFDLIDSISNAHDLAGIIALKSIPNGKLIGDSFPENYPNSSSYELYVNGYGGERSFVFKTDVIKRYKFPVVGGEKFCTEAVVYDQIDLKYKYSISNHILTVCDYQVDGLTSNLFPLMVKNAIGYKIYYAQRIDMAINKNERLGYAIRYNAFNFIKKECNHDYLGRHMHLVRLTLLLGYIASLYYKFKSK